MGFCSIEDDEIDLKPKQVQKQTPKQDRSYKSKSGMSGAEQGFYKKLVTIFSEQYNVQFQVPLSSVIKKESSERFQNELYRTIDFALFDKDTFEPVILIELNDKSHLEGRRQYRDIKVKEICEQAGLKIVTFWTQYENKPEYIKKRVIEFINK